MSWTYVAYDKDKWLAVVQTVMNIRLPGSARNFFYSLSKYRLLAVTLWFVIYDDIRNVWSAISASPVVIFCSYRKEIF